MDSPLKWPGGKGYLATRLWEIARAVPHTHRVELYGGSLAFTLATDPEGYSEVVNDLNGGLVNFWRVIQDEQLFQRFECAIDAVPFSEWEWEAAGGALEEWGSLGRPSPSAVAAKAFFIRCRQSMAGRMDSFAPLSRNRVRRGMNEQASAWLSAVEGLPAVHARMRRVVVVGPKPALDVIRQQDGPNTLFYADPPYVHSTRTTTHEYGEREMTETQHFDLLKVLGGIKGKFMLSGYRCPMYDGDAERFGWKRHDFELPNNAASGKTKRRMVESVWCNF
jgi:DNA adenine methylase